MNKHLVEIREELQEMAEKEAMKLWELREKQRSTDAAQKQCRRSEKKHTGCIRQEQTTLTD